MGNEILAEAIDKAADSVTSGESLAGPLAKSKVFPPAMMDMIAVAEESNSLEKGADRHRRHAGGADRPANRPVCALCSSR